jgi:threonyl-tRNA synthetase
MSEQKEVVPEEAAQLAPNDHRRLGQELGLFTFSDLVGSGLPLWLPKGATVRRILERFIVDTEIAWGYQHVYTPDIAKLELYKTSGHYPYYKDSMYAPIEIDEHEFMLRPMTCPHHFELYSDRPKSYRDLPLRIAELAKLYRYEGSGELSGLVRVRSFCLADAHIICADKDQAATEVSKALDLIEHIASVFGLKLGDNYSYRLSLGDRKDDKKYYKNDAAWDEGETMLRSVLQNRGGQFVEAEGEAAFYGPKIDIQMKDARGKENTAFTVQYDFCMPDRFNLTYTDAEGKEKRPVVVHRSSIGAIERVMAFLIEHYAGAFPTWLAPVQVMVLPIGESHRAYGEELGATLKASGIRAEVDSSDESLGKRIRKAKTGKVPYLMVVGDKEVEAKTVSLEHRKEGQLGAKSLTEAMEIIHKDVSEKK